MKDLGLIVWITQLGFGVAVPLAGFVLLALWLQQRFGWGGWILWVGIALGVICAIRNLRASLEMLNRFGNRNREEEPPPVSFNDHD